MQRAINSAGDPASMTAKARQAFLSSFGVRHYCALGCRVDIDQTMPEEARMRAARLAQQAHFRRMVHAREKKRRGIGS
jgi:hypothetical protein